jgi:HAD superfamily hydrolase (TIGR01484 family)
MQPLSSLSVETCRRIRGVVFDVDDTITAGGRIQREAFTALWRLRAAGLISIAVTGRPLGFAELMARMWPISFAVGENGAGFVQVTDHVRTEYWDDDSTRAEQQQRLRVIRKSIERSLPWVRISDDNWARRCDLAFDIGERMRATPEQVAALREQIVNSGAHALVSSVHAHVQLGDHDKARGVVRGAQALLAVDIDHARDQFLFIGDSGNDAAAFAFFPVSVGVANVRHHLSALPTPPAFVSSLERGEGFAEIIDTLLSRRP